MELGKVMEGAELERSAMASPHDIAIKGSAPAQSTRPLESSHTETLGGSTHNAHRARSLGDVWAGAIARVQTQVSYNTSMLESHRRQVAEIERAVGRLHQEMGNVVAVLNDVRADLRARPAAAEPAYHDSGDLDVISRQIEAVTNKANEVDGLKMQIELMKNRIKRFEEQGSPAVHGQPPGTSASQRERSFYESSVPPQHHMHPPQHQPLPPIRTGSVVSPEDERRHAGFPQPPVVPSQGAPSYHPSSASRAISDEHLTMQPSPALGFRPSEHLPPPSVISGWRPAEGYAPGVLHPPPTNASGRAHAMESEPPNSGWAAVNVNQAPKRPFEEYRPSPYESPAPGSPKRPKLAPIMPRNSYGDESYAPTASSVHQPASATSDVLFNSRGHVPSDAEHTLSHPHSLTTPASASNNSYRFVSSTAQAESQDLWRPESDRTLSTQPATGGRGRGRGRGGRGGGRGGRGGTHGTHPDSQELGTPEWEKPDWTGSQISPNGYYNAMHTGRGGLVRTSEGVAGGPSDRQTHNFPATPSQGPHDPFAAAHVDGGSGNGSKKSRTKPIRNAEGILIRKDGRPDMRSVSSANNLRKVHAKKEAERNAELDVRTPTSARSLAPANSNSMSDDAEEGSHDRTPASTDAADRDEQQPETQERHQQLISKIFPYGFNGADGGCFPHDEEPATVPDTVVKTETDEAAAIPHENENGGSAMENVVMQEASDEHTQEQAESDGKTVTLPEKPDGETVANASEEQKQSAGESTTTL